MDRSSFNFPTHLSIVWGVTLAIVTLLEWHGLDRDPMRKQILSPFIERSISMTVSEETGPLSGERDTQYLVEFQFKGGLFLLYFFLPVLVFHGAAKLLSMVKRNRAAPRE